MGFSLKPKKFGWKTVIPDVLHRMHLTKFECFFCSDYLKAIVSFLEGSAKF